MNNVNKTYMCECNSEECKEFVPDETFLALKEKIMSRQQEYVTLKNHVPEGNVILFELDNYVIRRYKEEV
jgi:hypothetical protein